MRYCWPQYLLWLVISISAISTLLTACGRKGDLYLPKENDTTAATQEQEQDEPQVEPAEQQP